MATDIRNTNDAQEVFRKLVAQNLPNVIQTRNDSIRVGSIKSVDTSLLRVAVVLPGQKVLNNIQYSKGITDISVGDTCLIISPDPSNQAQSFVVGVFR